MKICRNCNSEITLDLRTCPYCNYPLKLDEHWIGRAKTLLLENQMKAVLVTKLIRQEAKVDLVEAKVIVLEAQKQLEKHDEEF